MISLLLALALSNMPPPPLDPCKGKKVGDACLTPRRGKGVCVESSCEKSEVGPDGKLTVVKTTCLTCPRPEPTK